jgi:hypothetical protein
MGKIDLRTNSLTNAKFARVRREKVRVLRDEGRLLLFLGGGLLTRLLGERGER